MLERISENLSEAMQNKVAFRIPIFGGIPVPVSCVVTMDNNGDTCDSFNTSHKKSLNLSLTGNR